MFAGRPTFLRAFVRPLSLALVGCLAVGYCAGWSPSQPYADPYADALIRAHTRAATALRHRSDSLAALATRAETVYAATRRSASARVAEVPALGIAGDTIVLTEGRFPVARPVVALVVAMSRALVAQDSALRVADRLIAVQRDQHQTDLARIAESDSTVTALQALIPKPPGKIRRVFLQLKAPALFLAGVVIGAKAVR
ncbi:hypothetical protein [Humibacter sp.]|uniref:hypothetical protein n=1 Tax=Humibacter sp. TaxID=1940291 RepID=UPI003F80B4EB